MGFGGRSLLLCAAVLAGAAVGGPLRPFAEAALTNHQPQRILVLGGDADRERMGLHLARRMNLPLVVSGGTNPEYAQYLVRDAGLTQDRVRLDYRAEDTLGNFTSLVDELQKGWGSSSAFGHQRRPPAKGDGCRRHRCWKPWNSAYRCCCQLSAPMP